MDCCDDDARKVWVVVAAWSPRRAVLTHAEPFLHAADTTEITDLVGMLFMARVDRLSPPPYEHEGGERILWPDLRLAPSIEEVKKRLGINSHEGEEL
jgi:hypothetical protein